MTHDDCELCLEGSSKNREVWRPTPEQFNRFLPYFLQQYPDEKCPKAGRAQFLPAINYDARDGSVGRKCHHMPHFPAKQRHSSHKVNVFKDKTSMQYMERSLRTQGSSCP